VTQKMGTVVMRSGSHVQLTALQNRDHELQTTSPFSNNGSVDRSTACCRHKNYIFVGGFLKVLFFCVTLYVRVAIVAALAGSCDLALSDYHLFGPFELKLGRTSLHQ
jgi:hypothetical protein